MVFESLVSDLLNRFIGDYVENLDKSQLKIGIWGGNVVLENLKVKENALSEFDVPFKVKAGLIGKLTLKIPWKNLYSDAVVATLDGLYLLVVPGATLKYDAAKEERDQQEAKQKELQRIEEALQKAACREKPQEDKKDSFVEKMATQVIKNLQVKISSIHLRYEDDLSDPQRPLSMGATLSELSLQTTDESWKSCILNEAAKIIYKLGRLDCLCAYWNVNSPMFHKGSRDYIVDQLKCGISSKDQELPHYQYIFRPISAAAQVTIDPTAELEMKRPRASLHLEVSNIDIEVTKPQYLTMVELLQSIDYMVKSAPYRRFRPDAPVHLNAKLWWRFSFNSVLQVQVRRADLMWSWSSIRQHRENLKAYKSAYKAKLLSPSRPGPDTERHIQDLEKVLDVFNITLVRQQAHMEVIRSGQKVVGKKKAAGGGGGGGGGGFFSSLFGRKAKKEVQEENKELATSGLDDLMTSEEKQKLYVAIGYSGSSHNLTLLPREYVAVVVSFQLCSSSVTLRERPGVAELLTVRMKDLSTSISQRPGAQAFRVEAALRHWSVTGLQQQGAVPSLIAPVGDSASSLLDVVYELNPEGGGADQLLRVHSQPVEIVYDALTVNGVADFFQTGRGLDLQGLSSATLSKLEEIKEKTAAGLSHIIETRRVLDLRVDLKPSHLLVPTAGSYSAGSDLLILDFGRLQLNSVEQSSSSSSSSTSSSLEEIMDRAYERYNVELRRVQVLYSKSGEAWRAALLQASSSSSSSLQHLLQPMDISLQLAKCLVEKDSRMPRFKVSGELPLLHLKISDQKIQQVLDLVHSIPLPNIGSSPSTPPEKVLSLARPAAPLLPPALLGAVETDSDEDASDQSDEGVQRPAAEELPEIHFLFEVKEVLVELTRQHQVSPVLSLRVSQLGAEGRRRSFDLSVTAYLRRVALDYCDGTGGRSRPLHLISCSEQQDSHLLKVEFIKADPNGPSFQTVFNSTEQTLKVEFSSLDFLLHTSALLDTISYLSRAAPPRSSATRRVERAGPDRTGPKAVKDGGVFSFKLLAVLGCFHVQVCDGGGSIADIRVQGLEASVAVQVKETQVFARLRDIVVTDVDPGTVHGKVVSIVGEEVFSLQLSLFPGATEGRGYSDTSQVDGKLTLRLGCIQIVYLHRFMMSLLTFVDNFQAAKEALGAATAQAASGVRGLAQRSVRLAVDVRLKAPLVIIPRSSSSHDALVMDLGLITVGNGFSLLPADGFSLPAVTEKMEVKLTQLKICRTRLQSDAPQHAILQPLDVELLVTRNLSASWFRRAPGVQVQGVLRALKVSLGQEDLAVLLDILLGNIGEGGQERRAHAGRRAREEAELAERQEAAPPRGDGAPAAAAGDVEENTVNVLLDFEIKEVLLTLKKPKGQEEAPFLVFHAAHLGTNAKVRRYDTCATTFIKKISVRCLEFKDAAGEPLSLVSSSVEPGAELLRVQYLKADRAGPGFTSVYNNTEQMINVTFTSLDLVLHTEALLSAIGFVSAALPPGRASFEERGSGPRAEEEESSPMSGVSPRLRPSGRSWQEVNSASCFPPAAPASPAGSEVIELKVVMTLGAFGVLLCDRSCNMADIKIQGVHGALLVQGTHTQVSARLRDFIVLNADPHSVHRKAVSIVGDEVFSFNVSLTPNATEGAGYSDTSRTDGSVRLSVGCIQVVYLHKFIMSLLNFTDHFQAAKEALGAATAQAAEKAASGVRGLAQKSFRLAVDVRLQAPIIIIPRSSTSHDALVMDLGLITVGNSFSLLPVDGCPLPAVVDNMDVELTQLKLSRGCTDPEARRPPTELLQPLNLHLNLKRNLAASWHKDMVPVEITGDLKPMKVELSQDDLTMLLRILMENLGEASAPRAEAGLQGPAAGGPRAGAVGPVGCEEEEEEEEETLRFTFNIESLGLVLYSNDPQQPSPPTRQQHLRLGGLAFHRLRASGSLQSGGGVALSAALSSCTLDDLRSGVQRVTSRMVGRRDRASAEPMVDLSYRQSAGRREAAAVLQAPYLCASVEFLMAVADFFLKALPPRPAPSAPLRPTAGPRLEAQTGPRVRTRLRLVVLDPEVVFVASLMQADAPSLVASFQCDFSLQAEEDGTQSARAHLRELKVLACPFIRSREDEAVTTVLRPCSVALEARTHPDRPLSGSVVVEEVIVKISPFILNAVQSITAAMTAEQSGEQSREAEADLGDLWSAMNLYSCNYWFLGVDRAPEATESLGEPGGRQEGQSFTAEVKVVQVTLESGLGHRTVPLLLAESSFSGSATNWSSLLQLRANMTLEVNYFNELQAVWEPLIERVDSGRRRWTLELEMKNNPVQDQSPVHGDDFVFLPEPRTFISVSSKDTLNITVSQSSLQVFHHLAQAFSGSRASSCAYSLKEKAPFSIRNCLGVPLFLQLSPSLRPAGPPAGPPAQGTLLQLPEDGSLDLEFCSSPASHGKLSALQRQESGLFHLTMVPSGYSEVADVSLDWPGRRLYAARGAARRESVSVLLQVDVVEGNKVVTVRSPLQIQNHFSVAFAVLRYCAASGGLESVGQAEPERELHIDLESYRSQLFVRPAGSLEGRYGASTSCLAWKEQVHRSQEVRSVLQCPAADAGLLPLAVVSLAVPDELRHIGSHGGRDWDPAYVIHLHPLAALRNLLPYTVRYMMECSADSVELPEGGSADLLTARLCGELLSLVLVRYQGRDWQGHVRLEAELPEFFPVRLVCDSDAGAALDLSVHATRAAGRLLLSLFSPYWLVNRTGRVLRYRGEDAGLKQPADARHAVLFSFRRKNRFSKSQLQLCVSTSSWSDGFSLDTVGSYGCVRCPADGKDFLVGVAIRLSSSSLTRVVTFSPFFTLVNRSSYELEVGEVTGPAATRWHYVSSSECLPLWPDDIAGKLCVRVVGSESTSKFFFFNRQDNGTLLSLAQCGGLIVDVNMSDVSTAVGFSDYYEGAAPALLLNHTPWVSIGYRQSGSAAARELKPGEARRFSWDDPAGVRKLSWSCEEHSGELDLLKDGVGQFSSGSLAQVHWVSFLDGRQRVLLFTEDVAVVTKARQAEELEQFQQEVKVSLQSLGLSLVNNANRQEIAYIGITSSGVVWEMKPRSRWKPLSQKSINQLEKTFQGQQAGWVRLEGNLEVNLDAAVMAMRRPFCSPLRRNFLSGVQVEFKQSPHQRSLRAQVHWLQVDNQLPGAIFPIVFHPVPPPKSIALDSEPKPFIDVSVITRFNRHSSVMQFKYFMALVQEMAVKIDQGFLGATLALFSPAADPQADKQKEQLLDGDLQLLQAELMEASLSDQSGLSFFEHFHISPIKLHLSLSLGSSGDDSSQETAALQSFNLLLKSIGATLTDVDDLIFKLAFFEVKYQFYRREKLMWAVVRHYSEQFLKQMYVLVLGLDVLGNPFGLIRGLSEGVEAFFYEPFQGAVQGPEEFAEGFVIGVRSLLGHTVGGAAGMVSRITGSVGKGLAAITMDKEYQQKRREEMNRPPRDFGQSLAKGGKGLLKGVLGGVTGIVTKPVEGAKKEGALGFFKGIGKGLVGVVARPTGGIVDMASSTFQGIQRAVESSQEVTQLRPVRLIQEDGVIRPYDLTESQGLDLFQRSGLQQLDGEVFRAHLQYPGHRKTTIIVTNRRVLCVKEIDFVGHFSREWECLFENFSRPPTVTGSQLRLYCKEQQMLKLSQDSVRNLELRDPNSAQKLHAALSEAQAAQQQRRMTSQKSRRFLEVQNQQ